MIWGFRLEVRPTLTSPKLINQELTQSDNGKFSLETHLKLNLKTQGSFL